DSVLGSWTYTYDSAFSDRISSATCTANCANGWGSDSWTYDEYGNRWTQTASVGPNGRYTFNSKNQITSASGTLYDNAGNMLNDGLGNTYSYDALSRLTGVNGTASTFMYDPFGNRVSQVVNGIATDFVYDGSTILHTNSSSHLGEDMRVPELGQYFGYSGSG